MMSAPTVQDVKVAFRDACAELGLDTDFLEFEEQEDVVVVKYGTLKGEYWHPLNALVWNELGGEYSHRTWVIPIAKATTPPVDLPPVEFRSAAEMAGVQPSDEEEPVHVERYDTILLKNLVTSPVKVRLFLDEEYLAELAETIKEKGILQPILVRPRPSGAFQIVAGEQRYRAARLAGLDRVPCLVKHMTDREAYETSLIENVQRRDLSDYEMAKALQHMLTHFPEEYPTQKVLAFKLGKGDAWISEHLAILDFEEKLSRDKLQELTHKQARELRAAPEKKREELIQEIEETGEVPSVKKIETKTKPKKGAYWCPSCERWLEPWQVNTEFDPPLHNYPMCMGQVERRTREKQQEPVKETDVKIPQVPYQERMRVKDSNAEAELGVALTTLVLEGKIPNSGTTDVEIPLKSTWPDRCWPDHKLAVYLDGDAVHEEDDPWDDEVDAMLRGRGWTVLREQYHAPLSKQRLREIVDVVVEALQ